MKRARLWPVGMCVALLGVSAASGVPTARAADPSPQEVQLARTLFEEGIRFEKAGNCPLALERYRRVATVKSSPSLKYHTGFCHEQLHEDVLALTYYQQAETEATQKQNQEVLTAVKAPLARLTQKVPKLVPQVSEVPGLEVSIDGKPIPQGLWGLEIRVEVGRHTVEGKAVGYAPFSQTREFGEGTRTEIKVNLTPNPVVAPVPSASASAAPSPPPSASASAAPSAVASAKPPPPSGAEPPPKQEGSSHTGAIIATAGAVVLVGGGFASFFYAGSLADQAKTDCLATVNCDDKKNGVRLFDALALTGWIGGAGLGAVAVIAWSSGGDKDSPEKKHSTMIMPGPGGITVRGSF
jgi:hypothetical protein